MSSFAPRGSIVQRDLFEPPNARRKHSSLNLGTTADGSIFTWQPPGEAELAAIVTRDNLEAVLATVQALAKPRAAR